MDNPREICSGEPTPAKWRRLGDYLRGQAIQAGQGVRVARNPVTGTTISVPPRVEYHRDTLPPFHVELGKTVEGETTTYYVTVTDGYVCERDLCAGSAVDALVYWPCPSRLTRGEPTKFTVADGDAIYVCVLETENGNIGATAPDEPVDLVVDDDGALSTNYIPGTPGQPGAYYYKLAKFDIVAGVPTLTQYLSGSHIHHVSGLTADARIMDCAEEPSQLLRLSFLSGRLVSIDETTAARPLSANVSEVGVYPCT